MRAWRDLQPADDCWAQGSGRCRRREQSARDRRRRPSAERARHTLRARLCDQRRRDHQRLHRISRRRRRSPGPPAHRGHPGSARTDLVRERRQRTGSSLGRRRYGAKADRQGIRAAAMHALANPTRFLRIARPATLWLLLVGAVLALGGMAAGLTLTPPDYLQGETVRILYIHVPAAWLGMAGWIGIAAASISQLVWRHPLAAVGARAVAPAGATFAAICLITGSIWGRPT